MRAPTVYTNGRILDIIRVMVLVPWRLYTHNDMRRMRRHITLGFIETAHRARGRAHPDSNYASCAYAFMFIYPVIKITLRPSCKPGIYLNYAGIWSTHGRSSEVERRRGTGQCDESHTETKLKPLAPHHITTIHCIL